MNRMRRSSIVVMVLFLQACTWVTGVEPTDLNSIKAGTGRQQIEELLGKPMVEQVTAIGPASVYKYQGVGVADGAEQCGIQCYELLLPFLWPLMERDARNEARKGERFLTVVYGADGKISHAFKNSEQ